MPQTYSDGSFVTVKLPLLDLNGDEVTPTGLSARLYDQDDEVLLASFSVDIPDEDEVEITISAAMNTLAAGESAGGRRVQLTVTTADGSFQQNVFYLLRARVVLTVPNSFQTYEQALVTASMMHGLLGWDSFDDVARQNALLEAANRLKRIGYCMPDPTYLDFQDRIMIQEKMRLPPELWDYMTTDLFATYPERFRSSLKRAQVVEANQILNPVDPSWKRRAGLMSESISESSMMFRPGKPLDLGISREALQHMTGFIDYHVSIAGR